MPLYIHPRAPGARDGGAYRPTTSSTGSSATRRRRVYSVRLITSGVFDQFPTLKVILGHMGEGLPFWLYRIDNNSFGRGHS